MTIPNLLLALVLFAAPVEAARLNAMGCEWQGADDSGEFIATAANVKCATASFRTGAASLQANPTAASQAASVGLWSPTAGTVTRMDTEVTTETDLYVSGYLKVATLPDADVDIVQLTNGTTRVCGLELATTGVLTTNQADGTAVGSAGPTIAASEWWFINLRCTVSATVGVITLEASPASTLVTRRPIQYSTVADANTGVLAINRVRFGTVSGSATMDVYFDDWRADDAAFPGPGRVALLKSNGQGNYTAWTNTCTNVDEIPPASADVITETTTGEAESCLTDDVSLNGPESITTLWAGAFIVSRTAGAGAPTINILARDNSTDQTSGASDTLNVNTRGFVTQWTTDSAAAAWTDSSIDGVELGVKSAVASSSTTTVSAIHGYVDIAQTALGGRSVAH